MSITKNLAFDIILSKIKVENQNDIFNAIASKAAKLCRCSPEEIIDLFQNNPNEVIFDVNNNAAIFDVKSKLITTPLLAITTLEKAIKFSKKDNCRVNIVAVVMSSDNCGAYHLQRLSNVARILRSKDLCIALNDSSDTDTMRALFTPAQAYLAAA